jgi:hypothetical protein
MTRFTSFMKVRVLSAVAMSAGDASRLAASARPSRPPYQPPSYPPFFFWDLSSPQSRAELRGEDLSDPLRRGWGLSDEGDCGEWAENPRSKCKRNDLSDPLCRCHDRWRFIRSSGSSMDGRWTVENVSMYGLYLQNSFKNYILP